MTTRRPTLTAGPASRHEAPGQLIREFSDGASGGLLSIHRNPVTDRLTVEVYRADTDVTTLPATPPAHHEIHDEVATPTTPDDLNTDDDILGTVSVFGRQLTPEQVEAFATHLILQAHAARVAAITYGPLRGYQGDDQS